MYISRKSYIALFDFLTGFACGAEVARRRGPGPQVGYEAPHDFNHWVAYRLHSELTDHWTKLFHWQNVGEEEGFDLFMRLLDEYISRVPKCVAKFSMRGRRFGQWVSNDEQAINYPDEVLLVTYTSDPGFFAYSNDPVKHFPAEGFFSSIERLEVRLGIGRRDLTVLDAEWGASVLAQPNL